MLHFYWGCACRHPPPPEPPPRKTHRSLLQLMVKLLDTIKSMLVNKMSSPRQQ